MLIFEVTRLVFADEFDTERDRDLEHEAQEIYVKDFTRDE